MAFKKIDIKVVLFLIVVSFSYTWYLFRTILMNPGHVMYESYGDGAKNYFTYLYHTLFGKGFHFEGMQYPWGEHIIFTDNQPLLAYPLSYLKDTFNLNITDLLAIMNLMTPILFIFSILALYKLLTWLQINGYLSALFALMICAMPPNFYRMFGHFGLSYTINIILILFLILKHQANKNPKYLFGIFIINFLFSFIHVYNLAIGSIMLLAYAFTFFILESDTLKIRAKHILFIVASVALGFICLKSIFYFTDLIQDRPTNPWGILNYTTTFGEVFTSNFSNLGKTFSLIFDGFVSTQLGEGYAYVGFVSGLYCLFLISNVIFFLSRKKHSLGYSPLLIHEKYLILIGTLSLIIALGIPFVWNMEFLLDYFPLFKQFRSLGRLAIIFYFCINIAAAIRINEVAKTLKVNKLQKIGYLFLGFVFLFWSLEIFSYSKYIQRRADESSHKYSDFFSSFKKDSNNNPIIERDSNYQAILALPFFCVGSEKITKEPSNGDIGNSFEISLRTGLPLINSMMSRTSWSHTFELARLIGGEYSNKDFISSLLNSKPILLIYNKHQNCTPDENYLISQSTKIKEDENNIYFNLDWKKLTQRSKATVDSLNLLKIADLDQSNYLYKSYDEIENSKAFFNYGALDIHNRDSIIIFESPMNVDTNSKFEFSCWAMIPGDDYRMPYCSLEFLNSKHEQVKTLNVHFSSATDISNIWFRASEFIDLDSNTKFVKAIFHNEDKHPATLLDEAMLKALQNFAAVESKDSKFRMYNNHKIKLKH